MPPIIPDCDEVFSKFFDRWYDADDREYKGFAFTRADMLISSPLALTGAEISNLSEDTQKDVHGRILRMLQSVKSDWPSYLDLSGEIDTAWIEAFDRYYDTNKIAELLFEADPADYSFESLSLYYLIKKRL